MRSTVFFLALLSLSLIHHTANALSPHTLNFGPSSNLKPQPKTPTTAPNHARTPSHAPGFQSSPAFQFPHLQLRPTVQAGRRYATSAASPLSQPARLAAAPKLARSARLAPLMMVSRDAAQTAEAQMPLTVFREELEAGRVTPENLQEKLQGTPLPKNPRHITGVLPNGLEYSILPNRAPAGRFECHLQVKAGSADETVKQQGMAHMCEHVSYMGSRKRERLFGTSSQTNAQTDFHHTVYWASCPTLRPSTGVPMLPLALDALLDVMEARFEGSRVEKERSAILSEAAMVNTIDYRVEVQLLAALHGENRLRKRFPIGLVEQIQNWSTSEVQEFHRAHYRPNNAHLYVIGDVDPELAEALVHKMFSHLEARPAPEYAAEEEMEFPNLKTQNPFFPPINHYWSGSKVFGRDACSVHSFEHELMQGVSLHVFAKFPVEPIVTLQDYLAAVVKRLVVVALQVRLNVHSRGDPISMVEFSYLDSPREACAVSALDMMATAQHWPQAVNIVVREIKKMALYGLSQSELQRCLSALLSDSSQLAAQGDRMSNQEQLQFLMESKACGHTFMDPHQLQEATNLVASCISLEQVNEAAAALCLPLATFGKEGSPMPSSLVACFPPGTKISENEVVAAFESAAAQEVASMEEVRVPATLIAPEKQRQLIAERKPTWLPDLQGEGDDDGFGVVQKRLSNGIKVNYRSSEAESQRGHIRVTVPCGRTMESEFKRGAMAIGARTMQEGGAMLGWSREQVELFCVDHLIMAEVASNEEFLFMEFVFPTSKVSEGPDHVTGVEGVMQVLHALLHAYKWEEDALDRAKQAFRQAHEQVGKNLEAAAAEHLLSAMTDKDYRFLSVEPADLEALSLDDVKHAIESFLTTDNIEVSFSGDLSGPEVEALALTYLGTIPPSESQIKSRPLSIPMASAAPPGGRNLFLEVPDSDARAVAYVAGTAPNKWGVMAGGQEALAEPAATGVDDVAGGRKRGGLLPYLKKFGQGITRRGGEGAQGAVSTTLDQDFRRHPLFPCVTLQLLQEVLNRRLFSTVRERKRLTYDANFHLTAFERIQGSWYLVTVTAKPELAQKALDACKETLHAAQTWDPITRDNLQSAAYELISRHEGALQTNRYWVELMSGLQLECVPGKDPSYYRDFAPMIQSVHVGDVQAMLDCLATDEQGMWTCIGSSGGSAGAEGAAEDGADDMDLHGHQPPSIATGRRI